MHPERGEMETGATASFLVDFARKREEQVDYDVRDDESDDDRPASPRDPDSEESEIEDEFGRQKMVKRRYCPARFCPHLLVSTWLWY
jgi:hypothetical protein